MQPDDVQLLQRTAKGDAEAFAAFYDRHAADILGHLCRLVSNRTEAEDILQEAFCQVWKQADRFDVKRGSPKAWLYLIARSRALDRLRRKRTPIPLDAIGDRPSLTAPDLISQNEIASLLSGALAELPPEQAQALQLAFYQGLTHEQIAEHQGVPLGTAKTRIRLGMNRLRDRLAGNGDWLA